METGYHHDKSELIGMSHENEHRLNVIQFSSHLFSNNNNNNCLRFLNRAHLFWLIYTVVWL